MCDIQEFSNDSEEELAAEEKEGKTLAASDSWIGLANCTPHRLKVKTFFFSATVKTYSEYVREVETKGEERFGLPCSGHHLGHILIRKQLMVGVLDFYQVLVQHCFKK